MSDLAQRLRLNATIPLVMEAADQLEENTAIMDAARTRIEALEAALNDIIIRADDYDEAATIARAALAPEQDK